MGDVAQHLAGEATRSVPAVKHRTIAVLFEMKIIYTPFTPRPGFEKRAAGNPAPVGRKGSVLLLNQRLCDERTLWTRPKEDGVEAFCWFSAWWFLLLTIVSVRYMMCHTRGGLSW